jgi:hypothetical protein
MVSLPAINAGADDRRARLCSIDGGDRLMAFPIDHVYLNGNVLVGAVRRYEAKAAIQESDNGLMDGNA